MSIKQNKSVFVAGEAVRDSLRFGNRCGGRTPPNGESKVSERITGKERLLRRLVDSFPEVTTLSEALTVGALMAIAEGDAYYTDESFILTSVPNELANGIWVTQANADKNNRDENFLTFEAGQEPVSVYIAFDPAGDPPLSSSHSFTPVTLSADMTVSDPGVSAFSIVMAGEVTGRVIIGGNKSGSGAVSQQGYIVIVVP